MLFRSAADETLSYLLGWYESIDFELVQTYRSESKFIAEEEWVERRKELANFFTERADVHSFIPNLPFKSEASADAEEAGEEGEAEDDDEGAAEITSQAEASASGTGGSAETEAPAA